MKLDKWQALGIISAIFNPLPTGILAGYVLHRDKYKSGKFLMLLSVIWTAVLAYVYMAA